MISNQKGDAMRLECATSTKKGMTRTVNEDGFHVDQDAGVFIVADGVGGRSQGKMTSKIVIDVLPRALRDNLDPNSDLSDPKVHTRISKILTTLNAEIFKEAEKSFIADAMGSTVAIVIIRGGILLTAHLGDSLAYLLRDGELSRIVNPHTLARAQGAKETISPKESKHHPEHGKLTRFLGTQGICVPEITHRPSLVNDRVLLCTDGLYGALSMDEIHSALSAESSPAEAVDALMRTALDNEAEDDVTVALIDVKA